MTSRDDLRPGLIRRLQRHLVALTVGALVLSAGAGPAQAAVSSSPDAVAGFNGTVWATAYLGHTIYVGGDFTAAIVNGKSISRHRLAAVDADTGALLPWAPAADARVRAIATSDTSVFVAGAFSTVNGAKRDSLAKLDPSSGAVASSFKHAIGGSPYALAADHGRLYLGGAITAVDGANRPGLAAFSLASGALDGSWKPTVDDQVQAITSFGSRIYVGGKFHLVNGTTGYDKLVALDPAGGSIVKTFKPHAAVVSYEVAVTSDGVYSAQGGQGGKVAAYTNTGELRWTATFDGDVQAVTALGNAVYAGGHFDRACRSSRTGDHGVCLDGSDSRVKLAALDAGDGGLLGWTANANGVEGVLTMTHSDALGTVVAGGAFTTINGKLRNRLAQFS